jgi:hypothetical protein
MYLSGPQTLITLPSGSMTRREIAHGDRAPERLATHDLGVLVDDPRRTGGEAIGIVMIRSAGMGYGRVSLLRHNRREGKKVQNGA